MLPVEPLSLGVSPTLPSEPLLLSAGVLLSPVFGVVGVDELLAFTLPEPELGVVADKPFVPTEPEPAFGVVPVVPPLSPVVEPSPNLPSRFSMLLVNL